MVEAIRVGNLMRLFWALRHAEDRPAGIADAVAERVTAQEAQTLSNRLNREADQWPVSEFSGWPWRR